MSAAPRRVYGEIAGVPEGRQFANRADLHEYGVHRPLQAGISGSSTAAADSIVVSGGYEDDEDRGDFIIYTGQGGNDPGTGKQIAHQELVRGNMGLVLAMREGVPVRVIRGAHPHSTHGPRTGYRYDGLFRVEDCWHEIGRSGYRIWRFRLRKIEKDALTVVTSGDLLPRNTFATASRERRVPALAASANDTDDVDETGEDQGEAQRPERRPMTVARIIRNTAVALEVKRLHSFICQVCQKPLTTPRGEYAEAAHIRPLGSPHDGPDVRGNVLCLCPNHHVMFDYGAFTLDDDLRVTGTKSQIRIVKAHEIDLDYVRYHRDHYG